MRNSAMRRSARHLAALLCMVAGFGGLAAGQLLSPVYASDHHVTLLRLDGAIDPISSDFLRRGLDVSAQGGARLLIVEIDTPGGLLDSTREMVEAILASEIPVVVYVSPPGAQAASAGTFVTVAAHIAAMAPTTNIGAASPVGPSGEDLPDTIKSKATEDVAAFIRSIADERGRNSDALERTVLEATSYTATEALDENVVDLIADDIDDLLSQLHGLAVSLPEGEVVLDTKGVEIQEIARNPVERFLGFVADPNVAFLLLSLGSLGILIELMSPGFIGPGVAGVIALALAFVALGNLPVNWAGVALIAAAMVMFFLEAQAPGIGVFGVGGAISFILGAFLLFGGFEAPALPSPSFRVSFWLIGAMGGLMFAFVATFIWRLRQAAAASMVLESVSLEGQVGRATTPLTPRGMVQVADERWSAVSESGDSIDVGEEVIVLEVDGLTLRVFKLDA